MSILLFYRRVFPSQATMTSFRIAWFGISVWCILWLISTLFAAIFQCYPVSFAWTKVATTIKGTCLDFPALLYATAVLNIITDVAILLLPMPIVWHLRIQMSQKIAISGIFLLGGLYTARFPFISQTC